MLLKGNSPHANKHVHGFIHHGLNGVNHIVAVVAWQLESQTFFHTVQESGRGRFPNAHGAIALYVGMAAHRAESCASTTDMSVHEQQVHDFLNDSNTVPVLRQPHGPTSDGRL